MRGAVYRGVRYIVLRVVRCVVKCGAVMLNVTDVSRIFVCMVGVFRFDLIYVVLIIFLVSHIISLYRGEFADVLLVMFTVYHSKAKYAMQNRNFLLKQFAVTSDFDLT